MKDILLDNSWVERVCLPKDKGGLGLMSIKQRNQVLLAKWVWRAYKERGSFWNKIIVERYGKAWNYDLSMINSSMCSPIIKSIVSAKSVPQVDSFMNRSNFRWILKSGTQILFCEDWWHGKEPLYQSYQSLFTLVSQQHLTVKDFLSLWEENKEGETLWLEKPSSACVDEFSMFSREMENISLTNDIDMLIWTHADGIFNTKHCYMELNKQMSNIKGDKHTWDLIWSIKVPPKIQLFLWKIQWRTIPTRKFLKTRLKGLNDICPWCDSHSESVTHLFWECEVSKWAWLFVSN